MQKSDESNLKGLNLIDVNVSKIPKKNHFKVPHIGWVKFKIVGAKKLIGLKILIFRLLFCSLLF